MADQIPSGDRWVKRWMRSLVAPGLTNKPWAVSSFLPPSIPPPPPRISAKPTRAAVTGTVLNGYDFVANGNGGCYAGRTITGTPLLTQAYLEGIFALGSDLPGESRAAADDLMIVNEAERGLSDDNLHWLTDSACKSPWCHGWLRGTVDLNGTVYPVLYIDIARPWQCGTI